MIAQKGNKTIKLKKTVLEQNVSKLFCCHTYDYELFLKLVLNFGQLL